MENNPTVIANHLRNLKFTDRSCTLAVELNDHVNRYRASMTLATFNLFDSSAISSIDYDTYVWTYACVATRTSGKPSRTMSRLPELLFILDDVCSALRSVLDNRAKRASALGNLGSAVTAQARTQYAAITRAVATPAPPPQAISQPDGSFHVLNAFTIPGYDHPDCLNNPGMCCFYCAVANHTLPECTILKSDCVRNIMRAGVDRTCFEKHGSATAKKRKRDVNASLRPIHDRDRAGVVMTEDVVAFKMAD
ncbi:hypothetical protein DYB35_012315 [Aphanomyces astaci]|uniref:Uncharacterized protein n=1 Tax=Aphanomyces astaci TaxID=112090 RepID=A0A3R6Y2K7_APHAT|nr:hypothetical protein DYB35_012315 [Aphanomyces astaci]